MDGFASNPGEELMLQAVLGTGRAVHMPGRQQGRARV
jgi:hypothetical protein